MAFPWILQRYIFREMAKTFLLTAVALTGVLGLGGGVLNMIRLGDATPGQLLRLMALLLPVAIALTLPIAALFSAAATYGRLSADNEFVACRSSGINMHLLFLPTVVLSLISATITFTFINFLIPGMVRNLNEFVGADLGQLIERRLSRPRGITLGGKYRIYADDTEVEASDAGHLALYRVAFVEVHGEEWVRHGTAREVHLYLEQNESRRWISGWMTGLSFYDRKAGRFTDLEGQAIHRTELPSLVPQEVKFLNLGELLYYRTHPDQWRTVDEAMKRLRTAVGRWVIYDALWTDYETDHEIVLEDRSSHYRIFSAAGGRVPREGGLELTEVNIEEVRRGHHRSYVAERAILEIARGGTLGTGEIDINVYQVQVTDGQRRFDRARETIGPIAIPGDLIARIEQIPDEDLLNPVERRPPHDPRYVQRVKATEARAAALREITGTLHQRMAFSASVLVLVTLGAALGIVFRDSHAVTAFGISFVPSLVVIVAIVMGRQMANNPPTHALGLLVMWGGLALVAGLNVWTLTRWVRR